MIYSQDIGSPNNSSNQGAKPSLVWSSGHTGQIKLALATVNVARANMQNPVFLEKILQTELDDAWVDGGGLDLTERTGS